MPTTPERALQAILKTLHHGDPNKLRKAELLELRKEVIRLAAGGITGERVPKPKYIKPDPDYERAIALVLGYDGPNTFMRSLKLGVDSYGGITVNQMHAVLSPPYADDIDRMELEGIDPKSVAFHWQALDALRERRAQKRQAAKEQSA